MAEIYGGRAPGEQQHTKAVSIAIGVVVVLALLIALAIWRS